MFADSSLANAISVSLVVGQKGFWNLVQKSMNCLRLLRWFLLVPSANILDWESRALSSSAWNWSSATKSPSEDVGSTGPGGGEGGGTGGGEGDGVVNEAVDLPSCCCVLNLFGRNPGCTESLPLCRAPKLGLEDLAATRNFPSPGPSEPWDKLC